MKNPVFLLERLYLRYALFIVIHTKKTLNLVNVKKNKIDERLKLLTNLISPGKNKKKNREKTGELEKILN